MFVGILVIIVIFSQLTPSLEACHHLSRIQVTGTYLQGLHGWKFSGLILNSVDSNSFFDLFSVYLKTIDHLNLKLMLFVGILQVLRFDFKKFWIWEKLNFHPWVCKQVRHGTVCSSTCTETSWNLEILQVTSSQVKVFRINPEFRILCPTFHRN